MGRPTKLLTQLVRNSQLHITQTSRVCPKQLLDAALLAPALLPTRKQANRQGVKGGPQNNFCQPFDLSERNPAFGDGSQTAYAKLASEDPLKLNANDDQIKHREGTWAALETHAMLALPNLSPAGILQFLYLAQRGNYNPSEFIRELNTSLLHGEPVAPPLEMFWRLWTANDLALLYKLLTQHNCTNEALFAKLHASISSKLPYFGPSDIALIISAGGQTQNFAATQALLEPVRIDGSLDASGGPGCQGVEHQSGAIPHAKAPCLLVVLLDSFSKQLPTTSVNDCVKVFVSVSQIYNNVVSNPPDSIEACQRLAVSISRQDDPPVPVHGCLQLQAVQAGEKANGGGAQYPHPDVIAASWKASLSPISLLSLHVQRNIVSAPSKAVLQYVCFCSKAARWTICMLDVVSSPLNVEILDRGEMEDWQRGKSPPNVPLHAAIAEALDAAATARSQLSSEREGLRSSEQETGSVDSATHTGSCQGVDTSAITSGSLFTCLHAAAIRGTDEAAHQIEVTCASAEASSCHHAIRRMLADAIPKVCTTPADLGISEGMRLLDLLWQLRSSLQFPIVFSQIEGLFFYLAANLHRLSVAESLALSACLELCLMSDGIVKIRPSATQGAEKLAGSGDSFSLEELANLLRHSISGRTGNASISLTEEVSMWCESQGRLVLKCLRELQQKILL